MIEVQVGLGERLIGPGLVGAERAAALQVASTAPKKIVLGRHLIAMGHKPAGWFSQVLDEAFEAQLDGVFGDEAGGLAWLTERMAKGVI